MKEENSSLKSKSDEVDTESGEGGSAVRVKCFLEAEADEENEDEGRGGYFLGGWFFLLGRGLN